MEEIFCFIFHIFSCADLLLKILTSIFVSLISYICWLHAWTVSSDRVFSSRQSVSIFHICLLLSWYAMFKFGPRKKGVGRLFDQSHFCQLFLADMKEILLCTVDMEGLPSFVSFHVRLFSSLAKKMLAGCLINLIPVDGSLQKWRKSCCGASSFTMCSLFLFGRIILVVVSSIWWEAYTTLPPYKQQVAHATVEQCCLILPG